MTPQSILPAIRFPFFDLLARLSASRRPAPRPVPPVEDREDRYAAYEEMLLANPAAFASEFGMQWMYTACRKY